MLSKIVFWGTTTCVVTKMMSDFDNQWPVCIKNLQKKILLATRESNTNNKQKQIRKQNYVPTN